MRACVPGAPPRRPQRSALLTLLPLPPPRTHAPPDAFNWCIVPDSSYDVFLFGGLAVVVACLLVGKLASLFVLLAGAAGGGRRGEARACMRRGWLDPCAPTQLCR